MLWKQQPRNRRIADVFAKCGLVERAGQGADRIFEESIKQSKSLPDFSHTDEYEVVLTLDGQIQDEGFLRFLAKLNKKEDLASFTAIDFLVLDYVRKEKHLPAEPPELKMQLKHLVELGIIESIGKGRSAQYMLCQKYYLHARKSGVYTRKRGLDRDTNKALLLKHIIAHTQNGSRLQELLQVLPMLSKDQVQKLVKELKLQGIIFNKGTTRSSLWYHSDILRQNGAIAAQSKILCSS